MKYNVKHTSRGHSFKIYKQESQRRSQKLFEGGPASRGGSGLSFIFKF